MQRGSMDKTATRVEAAAEDQEDGLLIQAPDLRAGKRVWGPGKLGDLHSLPEVGLAEEGRV